MAQRLKLGIRDLVEFCWRSGDLGGDAGPGVKALEGMQTHQYIQRRYRAEASAEVAIKHLARIDATEVELGGRIDLLFAAAQPPRIEEIKTVSAFRPGLENDSLHWAQLKCYAACYASANDLDEVDLSLNLVNLFTREEQRLVQPWRRDELLDFLDTTLRRYLRWYRQVEARQLQTRARARALEFPFGDYRAQQKLFAAEVYRAIRDRQRLLVEAPTGSGKTVSTLFPALKAIGEDECDQVVYLSAKISGQQQAVDTLERLQADVSYLVIQAKARSCVCNYDADEVDDDGNCRRCSGFYERLPAAREKLFARRRLDVAQIQQTAREFSLCPFELALQMLPWVDVVICDFNYVFDPLVQLTWFHDESRRRLLLIDELHNLVDRARGMYSAALERRQIRAALDAGNNRDIEQALGALQKSLDRELRAQADDETVAASVPPALLRACQRFGERLGMDIFSNKHIAGETLDFAKQVFRFQHIGQLFGQHHRSLANKPLGRRELRLVCLNAFEYLAQCYPMFHAVCGFSATLSPLAYFRDALGLGAECKTLQLESSFPPQHLAVCVGTHIDTRYREREAHIEAICAAIAASYRARPGNYLVFFSAYGFMQQVYTEFCQRHPRIRTRLQQRAADETAQREFLASFFAAEAPAGDHDAEAPAGGMLGFAIMGGRFAEGIDYQGEALIGAIVVGVGLPQVDSLQQLIRQDFEQMRLDGFDYAFRFPGLIRVLQSAGRVIRDERDRGVVVLLERRFGQRGYADHLPRWWQPRYCNNAESLEQFLSVFWKRMEDDDAANRDS